MGGKQPTSGTLRRDHTFLAFTASLGGGGYLIRPKLARNDPSRNPRVRVLVSGELHEYDGGAVVVLDFDWRGTGALDTRLVGNLAFAATSMRKTLNSATIAVTARTHFAISLIPYFCAPGS